MSKARVTKDVFLERLHEKYSTDLSLETKSVILEQAKRKTLDKISAGNI